MTIEERIRQNKFKHVYHKLSVNLMYTTGLMESFIKDHFKNYDVTLQQYNILRILRGAGSKPLSTLQIRERMMDKMSDTSRIVNRLVLKKLVTKKISGRDSRLVDIRITEKGLKLLASLDDIEDKVALFLNAVSEQEAETISALLDRIHSASK